MQDGESSVPLPLFQLDMSLADDCLSLLLSPAEDEFVEGVGVIMEGFVEVCSVVDRMLENEDLVCTVIEEEGLEVQMAMRDLVLDEDFEEHRSTASGLLAGAYQDVVTFTSKYNPFRCALLEMGVAAGARMEAMVLRWCAHCWLCGQRDVQVSLSQARVDFYWSHRFLNVWRRSVWNFIASRSVYSRLESMEASGLALWFGVCLDTSGALQGNAH